MLNGHGRNRRSRYASSDLNGQIRHTVIISDSVMVCVVSDYQISYTCMIIVTIPHSKWIAQAVKNLTSHLHTCIHIRTSTPSPSRSFTPLRRGSADLLDASWQGTIAMFGLFRIFMLSVGSSILSWSPLKRRRPS